MEEWFIDIGQWKRSFALFDKTLTTSIALLFIFAYISE